MGNYFIELYNLLVNRRWVFLPIILGLFVFAGFLASKLELEEDISRMMPLDDKVQELNTVFESSKFMDKLVLTAHLSDSTKKDPDKLIAFVDLFVDSLSARYQPQYIDDITYKFDDDIIQKVYGTFAENLPFFLTEQDYASIDTMTSPESITSTMGKNYKTLVSPVSMVMKKFIVQDPIGITGLALKKWRNSNSMIITSF